MADLSIRVQFDQGPIRRMIRRVEEVEALSGEVDAPEMVAIGRAILIEAHVAIDEAMRVSPGTHR